MSGLGSTAAMPEPVATTPMAATAIPITFATSRGNLTPESRRTCMFDMVPTLSRPFSRDPAGSLTQGTRLWQRQSLMGEPHVHPLRRRGDRPARRPELAGKGVEDVDHL